MLIPIIITPLSPRPMYSPLSVLDHALHSIPGLVWIFVLGTLGGTLYGIFEVVTVYSSSSSAIERL